MASRRDPMKGVVVETKSRPKKGLPALSADQVRQAFGPIINQVPSQKIQGPEPKTVDDFASAIDTEWREAQDRFLSIGGLLVQAERTLAQPEYLVLCERLPFGKATRSQLLTAYRCVQSGKVPAEMAVVGYSTLYQVAQLSDEEFKKAAEAGLLRPDVKRTELVEFRKWVRGKEKGTAPGRASRNAPTQTTSGLDVIALRVRREMLLAELREIEQQLAEAGETV
jgi:hypothetical protein